MKRSDPHTMWWTRGRRGVSSAANGVNARQALANLLCEGGDSRLHLSHGRNKYHCPPEPVGDGNIGPVLRSSCTCSPPSALGFSHALEKWHQLQGACVDSTSTAFQSAFGHQMQSVRRRVAEAFDLPEGTAVVLAASGTDAEYVPLAIARELQHLVETDASPGAIHSVLVAAEEVGGESMPVNHNQNNRTIPLSVFVFHARWMQGGLCR